MDQDTRRLPALRQEWRCGARKADGYRCNALLGRFDLTALCGEIKCPKCAALRVWPPPRR